MSVDCAELPDSIQKIGEYSMACEYSATVPNISSSYLPTSLEILEEGSLYGTEFPNATVYIPAGVTTIEDYSLYYTDLISAYFYGDAPAHFGENVFSQSDDFTIYYMEGASGWTDSPAYDSATKTWNGYKLATWSLPLAITTQPKSVTKTVGQTATFTVAASGSNLTYQWQYKTVGGSWKNSTTGGYNTATLSVGAVEARNGYQYRCIVTGGGTTVTSDAATLTVKAAATITTQPKSVTKTVGQTATFTVAASGSNLTYQWQYKTVGGSWKNSTTGGYNTATLSVGAVVARNGYQYRCIVTGGGASVTSEAAILTVV